MQCPSIRDFKGRRIGRTGFAPVVNARGIDIGVAQPFLDLRNVGLVFQGAGGGGGREV